jgi:hypothetical protein
MINNDLYLTPTLNVSNNYYYKFSQNFVTLKDSFINYINEEKTLEFLDQRIVHFQPGNNDLKVNMPLLSVEWQVDEVSVYYEREVTQLTDLLSKVGGLMSLLFTVIGIFLRPI